MAWNQFKSSFRRAAETNRLAACAPQTLRLRVDFSSALRELRCLLFQSIFDCCFFRDALLSGVLPYVFRNAHGTKMPATHRTEMGGLRAFLRQRLTKLMPIIFALAGWP
jgi:hypothetical protein